MVETAEQMYKSFLLGIKKEQSTIVPPNTFNLLINEEQDKWFKEKALAIELDQKRIDDFQILRVVTDGLSEFVDEDNNTIVLNPIGPDTHHGGGVYGNIFSLPVSPTIEYNNIVLIHGGGSPSKQKYPQYRRLLNIFFKIYYINNSCGLSGVSDWLEGRIMRSDKHAEILKNPYRKPSDSKLYYEIISNKVRLITNTQSEGLCMRLEYLRYPRKIFFDVTNVNHVHCELAPEQQQEIIDRAVLSYIERSKNQRYKTANYEYQKEQVLK